jgi:hypothetical protein
MTTSFSLAAFLFDVGTRLMPRHRQAWSIAMTSEFSALPTQNERRLFALGYLKTCFVAFATTTRGVSILGRFGMGTGFVLLALWCSYMALGLRAPDQTITPIFLGISGLYMVIGLSHAHSTILTKRLSILGVFFATVSLLGLALNLLPIPASAHNLAKALSIEVLVIMLISGIIAKCLSALEVTAMDSNFIA